MQQLKMYWLKGTEIKHYPLPEGYSVSNYKCEADKLAWVECCKNGLVADDATAEAYDNSITSRTDIRQEEDVFFLDYNGEHIGTVTAYVDTEDNMGDMHMVGIRTDFRGKGLAKYLSEITLRHLGEKDIPYIALTTDEWRKGAVASYLHAGFLPVEYDEGMEARWQAIIDEYGIDTLDMVYEDGSYCRTLTRNK